jgi:hypothetical protein
MPAAIALPVELAVRTTQLPSLLIVGDPSGLAVNREALVELELGWEVMFAGSAFEAHAIPAVRDIDVILIDLDRRG